MKLCAALLREQDRRLGLWMKRLDVTICEFFSRHYGKVEAQSSWHLARRQLKQRQSATPRVCTRVLFSRRTHWFGHPGTPPRPRIFLPRIFLLIFLLPLSFVRNHSRSCSETGEQVSVGQPPRVGRTLIVGFIMPADGPSGNLVGCRKGA